MKSSKISEGVKETSRFIGVADYVRLMPLKAKAYAHIPIKVT